MSTGGLAILEPYRDPNVDPISAQTIRPDPWMEKGSKSNLPDTAFDIKPEIELRLVNAAAVAEVVLGSAHLQRTSNGLRKTPPPIPIAPETSPSKTDAGIKKTRLGGDSNLSSPAFRLKNNNRIATNSNTTPRRIENCDSLNLNIAPI